MHLFVQCAAASASLGATASKSSRDSAGACLPQSTDMYTSMVVASCIISQHPSPLQPLFFLASCISTSCFCYLSLLSFFFLSLPLFLSFSLGPTRLQPSLLSSQSAPAMICDFLGRRRGGNSANAGAAAQKMLYFSDEEPDYHTTPSPTPAPASRYSFPRRHPDRSQRRRSANADILESVGLPPTVSYHDMKSLQDGLCIDDILGRRSTRSSRFKEAATIIGGNATQVARRASTSAARVARWSRTITPPHFFVNKTLRRSEPRHLDRYVDSPLFNHDQCTEERCQPHTMGKQYCCPCISTFFFFSRLLHSLFPLFFSYFYFLFFTNLKLFLQEKHILTMAAQLTQHGSRTLCHIWRRTAASSCSQASG